MVTARPGHEEPKIRERLLGAAEKLLLARGFCATSVSEICQAAGVTKGSFFHYFDSKEALGCAVAERYGARRREAMSALPARRLADPRARVFAFLDAFLDHADDPLLAQGCLIGTLGQEVSETHAAIRAVAERAFEQWADQLEEDLAAAKRRYAPRAAWFPRSLARHFLAVFEGSLILAKVGRGPAALREGLEHYRAYLTSLLGGGRRKRRAS